MILFIISNFFHFRSFYKSKQPNITQTPLPDGNLSEDDIDGDENDDYNPENVDMHDEANSESDHDEDYNPGSDSEPESEISVSSSEDEISDYDMPLLERKRRKTDEYTM